MPLKFLFCQAKHKSEDCKEKSFEEKKDILLKSAKFFNCCDQDVARFSVIQSKM